MEAKTNSNITENNQFNMSSLEAATTQNGEDDHYKEIDKDTVIHNNDAAAHKRLSTFDVIMHIIKGNLGPGILNLPYAFAIGGYIYSSILFAIVVFQGLYSMCLLVYCKFLVQQHYEALQQEKLNNTSMTINVVSSSSSNNSQDNTVVKKESNSNDSLISYGDVANAAFGRTGRWVVNFFAFTMQMGVCCAFLGLMATNLTAQTGLSMYISEGIITIALLFLVLVRHLKDIKWFSSFANLLMCIAILTAIVASTIQIVRYDGGAVNNDAVINDNTIANAVNTQTKPPTMFPDTISDGVQFITSIFFAFEGLALVLPIEKSFSMGYQKKEEEYAATKRFGFLTLYSMSFVGALFFVTGLINSIAFPDVSSGSITAYLRETFPNNIWYSIVNIFETVAVFLTFPLQMTPPSDIVDDMIDGGCCRSKRRISISSGGKSSTSCWGKYNWIARRYILVLLCAVANMIFGNNLSLLISFFGAAGQTNLALIPCAIYLKLQHMGIAPRNMVTSILNATIIIFCFCVMVAGIAYAVIDLIKAI